MGGKKPSVIQILECKVQWSLGLQRPSGRDP
jgi:hypothetical protein